MIQRIVKAALKLRFIIIAAAVLLLVLGVLQLREAKVDALPEFARPYVEVQTEALGLSAQEVEALITTPIEADLLNGVSWVDEIRSESIPGLSSIVLIFEKGTDIMRARQMVQERLIAVHALPNVSKPPTMLNPISSVNRLLEVGLSSKSLSLIEISVLARWTIVPKLAGLPGVANVSIWGQRKRQLQVQVDPEKLYEEKIGLNQIIETTGNALWVSPLSYLEASTPGTGGWIDTPNQRLGIRHILPISAPEELAQITLEDNFSILLGDITRVVEDHQPLIGDSIISESPAVLLVVEKFPWAATLDVTWEVENALEDLKPGLKGVHIDSSLFRPATYLETMQSNLFTCLLIGGVLILLALFLFFMNLSRACIAILSMVLSAVAGLLVLFFMGITINMMIIAGFMAAAVVIVDDGILSVKSIIRRREAGKKMGVSRPFILEAVAASRSNLVYALIIMVLFFLPVYILEGIGGAFYQSAALGYLIAIGVSLMTSLLFTPALSVLLLKEKDNSSGNSPVDRIFAGLSKGIVSFAVKIPRVLFSVILVVALLTAVAFFLLRNESLLPELKENDIVVYWENSATASLPAMNRTAALVTRELRALKGVSNVSSNIGRAVMSDRVSNINSGEFWISIDPDADYDAALTNVKKIISGYPGFSHETLTFLESRLRREFTSDSEFLVVRVYGDDLKVIEERAEDVRNKLAAMKGIIETEVLSTEETPALEIEVDLEKAKPYGLKPGEVRRTATSLISGIEVGSLFEDQKVFDVIVIGTPETRSSITRLENLWIDTSDGNYVRLKDVADVRVTPSVSNIKRDAVSRYIDITARVEGRDYSSLAAEINSTIKNMNFPLEYRAELLGEYGEHLASEERMTAFIIVMAIGVFLLLQVFFRNWPLAFFVLAALPVALTGGIAAVFAAFGGILSIGSILGFIALGGIAVRTAIVLIKYYIDAEMREGKAFGSELITEVTAGWSSAVWTSLITTALFFLPIIFTGNAAGLEIVFPMVIVIICGLISTLIFSFIGIPALYLMFGRKRQPELKEISIFEKSEKKEVSNERS